jgi:hypothetical protein
MVTGRGLASRTRCGSSSQRDGGQQSPRPHTHQGVGTPERGMVQTTRSVAIAAKNRTVPASRALEAPHRA